MSLSSIFKWFGCHTALLILCLWPSIGVLHAQSTSTYICNAQGYSHCTNLCGMLAAPGITTSVGLFGCHVNHMVPISGADSWTTNCTCTQTVTPPDGWCPGCLPFLCPIRPPWCPPDYIWHVATCSCEKETPLSPVFAQPPPLNCDECPCPECGDPDTVY